MRRAVLAILMTVGGSALTDAPQNIGEWHLLTGPQIERALTGRVLVYGTQWQDFRVSGKTLYFAGRDTWGYWEVRGDQYCSMWPPSDLWACYTMKTDGTKLRFIGDGGEITEAIYRE